MCYIKCNLKGEDNNERKDYARLKAQKRKNLTKLCRRNMARNKYTYYASVAKSRL